MGVIRAFIAVSLTDEIHKRLDEIIATFQSHLTDVPVRWVPATNVHLTLKFLGDVSEANIKILTDLLKTEAGTHKPFEVSVGGAGAFPNNRRPRIIWVGIEAPPELAGIQNTIETATARLGYPREERPFSPHLTLGRVSRNASTDDIHLISKVLESNRVGFLGATFVQEISLFRSDLQPTGAVYSRIMAAPLGLVE